MKLKLLLTMLFLITSSAFGTNYYYANNGNDSAPSNSILTPWKTMTKASSITYTGGDSILLKAGDYWNDPFITISTGRDAGTAYVVIGSYGTGPKPILSARDSISGWRTGWSRVSANIYKRYMASPTAGGLIRCWINGQEFGDAWKPTSTYITSRYRWYYDHTGAAIALDTLYMWVPVDGTDPGATYSSVEFGNVRTSAISISTRGYWKLVNLDVRGGYNCVNISNSAYFLVDNCTIGISSPGYGIHLSGTSTNFEVLNSVFDTGDTVWSQYGTPHDLGISEGVRAENGCNNGSVHNCLFKAWSHAAINIATSSGGAISSWDIVNNEFDGGGIDYGRALNIADVGVATNTANLTGIRMNKNYIHGWPTQSQFGGTHLSFKNNVVDTVYEAKFNQIRLDDAKALECFALTPGGYCGAIADSFINNIFMNCDHGAIKVEQFQGDGTVANYFGYNIMFQNGHASNVAQLTASNNDVFNFEKNSIWFKAGASTMGWQSFVSNTFYDSRGDYNVVWDWVTTGPNVRTGNSGTTLNSKNGAAYLGGNVVSSGNQSGDPLFSTSTTHWYDKYTVAANSPAISAGFVNIDLTNVGAPGVGVNTPASNPPAVPQKYILNRK